LQQIMAVAEISIFTLLFQSNRITIFRGYGFLNHENVCTTWQISTFQ